MRRLSLCLLLMTLCILPLCSQPLTLESVIAEINSEDSYSGSEIKTLLTEVGQMYEGEIRETAEAAVTAAVTPLLADLTVSRKATARAEADRDLWRMIAIGTGSAVGVLLILEAVHVVLAFIPH